MNAVKLANTTRFLFRKLKSVEKHSNVCCQVLNKIDLLDYTLEGCKQLSNSRIYKSLASKEGTNKKQISEANGLHKDVSVLSLHIYKVESVLKYYDRKYFISRNSLIYSRIFGAVTKID